MRFLGRTPFQHKKFLNFLSDLRAFRVYFHRHLKPRDPHFVILPKILVLHSLYKKALSYVLILLCCSLSLFLCLKCTQKCENWCFQSFSIIFAYFQERQEFRGSKFSIFENILGLTSMCNYFLSNLSCKPKIFKKFESLTIIKLNPK